MDEQLAAALLSEAGAAALCAIALLVEARALAVVIHRFALARVWRWLAAVPLAAGTLTLFQVLWTAALLGDSLLDPRQRLRLLAQAWAASAGVVLEITLGATLALLLVGMAGLFLCSLRGSEPAQAE
jgi:hypothetical protein